MLHCTWMVCWIANDTLLFRANYFPTDRVISKLNRCNHIHWQIYLLHWNMDQAKDGQESTFYMTTPPLISVRLFSLFFFFFVLFFFLASEKEKVLNHPPYSPDLSPFSFPRLKKCFLEISIRLEVLLPVLFISVSNRYQNKTIYLLRATG